MTNVSKKEAVSKPFRTPKTKFVRYRIEVKEAPPLIKIPPRFIVKRYNNCVNVQECAQACIYGVHLVDEDGKIADPIHELCRGCFSCVLNCPKNAISVEANPEFKKLGNSYYTPDRIRTIHFEAETGKVPVSGTGYKGPFAGRGLDSLWFDFSEIVRPTRDGIHGREYISTSVDLGRKLPYLRFGEDGRLLSTTPKTIGIPIPIILGAPACSKTKDNLQLAVAKAASRLGTFSNVDSEVYSESLLPYKSSIIPTFNPSEIDEFGYLIKLSRIVEVDLNEKDHQIQDSLERIKRINPSALVSFRVSYDENSHETAYMLAEKGADMISLHIDNKAVEEDPELIKNAICQVHSYLVKKNIRNEVTLIFGGGVAEAAHIPKSIILGADAVSIDLAYQIALGCKICHGTLDSEDCPLGIKDQDVEWAVQRIVNLVGSWRDQLLEVLSGMGLREVRRQRGEIGRAMFYEDLQMRIFGSDE